MLNRQNKKSLKSLIGDYRKFARRLKNELFERCKGNEAINESLEDIYLMLTTAQSEQRAFDDVIPDPDGFIKETALCFPIKRTRLVIVVLYCLLAVTLIGGCTWILVSAYAPVTLRRVTYVTYDGDSNSLSWNTIENADGYNVYLDGEFYKKTSGNVCILKDVDKENVNVSVTACAKAGTRYRDSEAGRAFNFKLQYPSSSLVLEKDPYVTAWEGDYKWMNLAYITFSSKSCDVGKVYFTPEYNVYGRVRDLDESPITALKENGVRIDYAEEMWYYGGKEYEFTLTNNTGFYETEFTMWFDILNIEFAKDLMLPEGDTLFAKHDWGDFHVYKEKSEKITFAEVDQKDVENHGVFVDSFATYGFNTVDNAEYLLLVRNEGQPKQLELIEKAMTLETLEGELTFKKGYTMLELSNILELLGEGNHYLFMYFNATCKILDAGENYRGLREYEGGGIYNNLFERRINASYLGYIVVYAEEDISVQLQHVRLNHGQSFSAEKEMLTLQPGVTYISNPSYDYYALVARQSIRGGQFPDPYSLELGSKFVIEKEFFLFNPYNEPIQVWAYKVNTSE